MNNNMDSFGNLNFYFQGLGIRFLTKVLLLGYVVTATVPRVSGVVNGKMKDRGVYVIQSVAEPRYVLTVADESVEKTKLAGKFLNQVITSKWKNFEEQKWTVKLFGKQYYFLTPVEKKLNNITYKVFMEEFPIPNIWELHGVTGEENENNKHWMIKLNRGKCLRLAGLELPLQQEKCDKKNVFQLWNFHLLNQ